MRPASPRSDTARFAVVIVTTDERVSPEAETYLAPDYDLRVLQTWDELTGPDQAGAPGCHIPGYRHRRRT